jgi:membrane-bound ClpP family serine protease
MMVSLKQVMTNLKQWSLSEKGFALLMIVVGAFFIAVGIHRFWVRPEHFGVLSLLGCVAGAFGAFFLLLVSDYLFHHAHLVFIPYFIFLIYFAIIQPHLGVGVGLALWYMLASQLRG